MPERLHLVQAVLQCAALAPRRIARRDTRLVGGDEGADAVEDLLFVDEFGLRVGFTKTKTKSILRFFPDFEISFKFSRFFRFRDFFKKFRDFQIFPKKTIRDFQILRFFQKIRDLKIFRCFIISRFSTHKKKK